MVKGILDTQHSAGLYGKDETQKDKSLKRTCDEFESVFIQYILKSMRKTVSEVGVLGKSNESEMVTAMFDENLAISIAHAGGIGLGEVLYQQLRKT
jgi:peptidoglycan hydrolase FlgJ